MDTDSENMPLECHVRRHYNKKELCFLFGDISLYYLNRMIATTPDLGEPLGTGFSPRQVMQLIEHYGLQRTFLARQAQIR